MITLFRIAVCALNGVIVISPCSITNILEKNSILAWSFRQHLEINTMVLLVRGRGNVSKSSSGWRWMSEGILPQENF